MSHDEDNDTGEHKGALHERVEALRASVEFFSSKMKQDRELWAAREFLEYLGVTVEPTELSPSEDEPPDVLYSEARFEIKEVLDPERRRGAEYKEALKKAESAKHPKELLEPYSPRSVTIDEAVARVAEASGRCKHKYAPAVIRQLDLLFYFNFQECGVIGHQLPRAGLVSGLQWRSISVVGNDCAFVVCANEDAPDFIRSACGKVFRKRV